MFSVSNICIIYKEKETPKQTLLEYLVIIIFYPNPCAIGDKITK